MVLFLPSQLNLIRAVRKWNGRHSLQLSHHFIPFPFGKPIFFKPKVNRWNRKLSQPLPLQNDDDLVHVAEFDRKQKTVERQTASIG